MDMLFRISILLLCLAFVESGVCDLKDFVDGNKFDKNFEMIGLTDRYTSGTEVRLQCKLGYSGYFKLICNDDGWDSVGDKCQARSCGHPGEAEFADFQLEAGNDFVFSSKVVYTCHKGYQMVSRRNFRRCMDEGWDGIVPTCEPIYCQPITVDQSVRVDGNMEEATYSSVIHFKCTSHDQALYGASEIYCDEDGEWKGVEGKGQSPTCGAVKCTPPEIIENGRIEEAQEYYRANQRLQYKCNKGFRESKYPSVCSLQGIRAVWSTNPVCEAVRCEIPAYQPPGTSFNPDKNVFSPGEEVTIRCGDKQWIGKNQRKAAKSLCQENGEWTIQPHCTDVTCIQPRDQHVYSYWNFRDSKKMGETVSYSCVSGYKKPDGVTHATCKREGWTPNPLCIDNKACSDLNVPNGLSQRHTQNSAYYTCNEGYKLFTKGWWASAECKDGKWSQTQKCIENTTCGELPVIPHGKATTGNTNNRVQQLHITCDQGYSGGNEPISCVDGEWKINEDDLTTICTADAPLCGPPPRVKYAVIMDPYQKEYVTQSEVTYECHENYTLQGDATIRCNNGQWETKNISCISPHKATEKNDVGPNRTLAAGPHKATEKNDVGPNRTLAAAPGACGKPPLIADGDIVAGIKQQYAENDQVEYACPSYYIIEGGPYKTCNNGEWTGEIRCIKPCTVDREVMDSHNIELKHSREDKIYSAHNDWIGFNCKTGTRKSGTVALRQQCVDGAMNLPTCSY